MKRSLFALGVLALSFTAHQAQAQCPVNPLLALNGKFAFQVEGVYPYVYGISGVFTAGPAFDRAGGAIGVLSITASSILGSTERGPVPVSYTRVESDAGRYTLNANCTGGTLVMNLSSRPMQYDFWFFDGGRQLYLVSTLGGRPATGRAAVAPNGCPAGLANPLQLLGGPTTFVAHGIDIFFLTSNANYGIAGVMNGVDASGTVGKLAITATSNLGFDGSVTSQENDAGRYQVNADCSGGSLFFNLSSRPVQFDFWYADGFQQLYFISTSGPPVLGVASR